MYLGTVFWIALAYAIFMPWVMRTISRPLVYGIISRKISEDGTCEMGRRDLLLLGVITGGSLLLAGPLAWARQLQRLVP